jgi:hypothetical protein
MVLCFFELQRRGSLWKKGRKDKRAQKLFDTSFIRALIQSMKMEPS